MAATISPVSFAQACTDLHTTPPIQVVWAVRNRNLNVVGLSRVGYEVDLLARVTLSALLLKSVKVVQLPPFSESC